MKVSTGLTWSRSLNLTQCNWYRFLARTRPKPGQKTEEVRMKQLTFSSVIEALLSGCWISAICLWSQPQCRCPDQPTSDQERNIRSYICVFNVATVTSNCLLTTMTAQFSVNDTWVPLHQNWRGYSHWKKNKERHPPTPSVFLNNHNVYVRLARARAIEFLTGSIDKKTKADV